ncbi:hypothetical protein BVC71_07555 [Marivivens niveibacter]|uniref:Glycerophosphoryl diester phosphodiesterase membrane domain-containing protein n=1 Tax=Marivivens niveibacter TaxID=1930667 RepID=A0A251WZ79_9RHOB|nr:hypothetical protein [Marivivens niveibacter]OUD09682.1 hypothetical protein BVC71_07555 [Marivivens niveibacter]
MAWKIVLHAFRMIFGNIVDALKVSVGPMLIFVVLTLVVGQIVNLPSGSFHDMGSVQPDTAGTMFFAVLILCAAAIFIFAWIAVAWHRFILLEEYPGVLPTLADRPIGQYVAKSLIIALILIVIGAAAGMVVMMLLSMGGLFLLSIGMSVVLLLINYLGLRFGLMLPAAAVGQNMSIGESMAKTKESSGQILGVTTILIAMNFASTLIVGMFYEFATIIAFVLDIATNWLFIMLNVSVLTTLFGHLVEGREIAD